MSTNLSDPNAPQTVSKPPGGTVDGMMDGVHLGGMPETIEGMWTLSAPAMMLSCPGPFQVTLQ